ncbi:MAG: TrkH family potassium uptake protein [Treponema sp.]|jgi:trk system potassium uptake protein TrkH|nr:TrkH family potassium uptake protein [Treponema sp.]
MPSASTRRTGAARVLSFLRVLALAAATLACALAVPAAASLHTGAGLHRHFLLPLAFCAAFALAVLLPTRRLRLTLTVRGGFTALAACWILAIAVGAAPLCTSGAVPSVIDGVFESVSGFSTTGATVISDVSGLAVSLNLWRCETQWLGGLAFLVMFLALMPLLGGFRQIQGESGGIEGGQLKIKTSSMIRFLVILYGSLTALQTILLMLAGMDFYDALSHSFSVIGTGGFSTKTEGVKFYGSASIEVIMTVFMILGGVNFTLYYALFTKRAREVWRNSEFRTYLGILFLLSALLALVILPRYGENVLTALRHALFHAASILTTSGFDAAYLNTWPAAAHTILFALLFVGGCSGSSASGVKIVRWVLLRNQLKNECLRMLHPQRVFVPRLNGRSVKSSAVFSAAAYLCLFLVLVLATTFAVACSGVSIGDALRTAFSTVSNVGAAMENTGQFAAYEQFAPAVKWWLCFVMLAGRLELFALLVVFVPGGRE